MTLPPPHTPLLSLCPLCCPVRPAQFSDARELFFTCGDDFFPLSPSQGSPYERSLKLVDDYQQVFVADRQHLSYQHYIKTVATSMLWKGAANNQFTAYEMSVNTNQFTDPPDRQTFPAAMPSVVFHYDLSPLQILIREESESFFRFFVNLCAIVGGVFTVASMVDGMVHNFASFGHKLQIGKGH